LLTFDKIAFILAAIFFKNKNGNSGFFCRGYFYKSEDGAGLTRFFKSFSARFLK